MEVFETVEGFSRALDAARSSGRSVGLVPTMGALHAGHRSLVARAAAECDHVAVTVFVNPLQFGDPDDIEHYPRTLPADLELCRGDGVSSVLAPSVAEMYPDWPAPPATAVSVTGPSQGWEGSARPGHFDGVCTVVAKLFSMAGRCRAYFGEKDFQQLAVVRRMAAVLSMPVEVVACPTVREPDGLALSSRNARLSAAERAAAPVLWHALCAGRQAVASGERRPGAVAGLMAATVAAEPLVRLEYAGAVDAASLAVPTSLDDPAEVRLLVAARVGPVRLIDNCDAPLPARAPQLAGAGPARAVDTRWRTPCNAA
ncbi:MAG: pantoate--beta-alanine ligase [Acidimicrobiales bacterium]